MRIEADMSAAGNVGNDMFPVEPVAVAGTTDMILTHAPLPLPRYLQLRP